MFANLTANFSVVARSTASAIQQQVLTPPSRRCPPPADQKATCSPLSFTASLAPTAALYRQPGNLPEFIKTVSKLRD